MLMLMKINYPVAEAALGQVAEMHHDKENYIAGVQVNSSQEESSVQAI
jgi:hypothetical protein